MLVSCWLLPLNSEWSIGAGTCFSEDLNAGSPKLSLCLETCHLSRQAACQKMPFQMSFSAGLLSRHWPEPDPLSFIEMAIS